MPIPQRTLRRYAPPLLLAAIVFSVYANIYANGFVFDDIALILHNRFMRDWDTLPDLLTHLSSAGFTRSEGGFYRPLQMGLYFLLYHAFGRSAVAFHLLNVALHAANAALVYALGLRLKFRPDASFAAALLWAVHPLHTEAVTYISATADPLFSFFCLLGLLALLPDFTPRKCLGAALLFVLALGAKESAVVFPALATACLFLLSKERLRFKTYIPTAPLWLIAAVYIMLRLHSISPIHGPYEGEYLALYADNLPNRLFTALSTLPVYAALLAWPAGLHMERDYPVFQTLWSWQVLVGLTMAAGAALQLVTRKAQRGLALSWGFIWFAAAMAPNTGILVPTDALIAEHWMYLPTAGLFLGVAQTLAVWLDKLKLKKTRMITAGVVALIAAALGARTLQQNKVWHDPVSFYENIISCGGNTDRAHNNLGIYYWNNEEFDKAIEQFKIVLSHPGNRPPHIIMHMHMDLALTYLHVAPDENDSMSFEALRAALPAATRIPEAVDELNKALEIEPGYFGTNQILSEIYAFQGDTEKAELYHQRAVNAPQ